MDKDGQTGPVFLRLLPGADALPEAAAPAAHAVNTPLHQPAALPAVTSPQVPVDRTVLPMQTPLGMPGWQQEFADKLVWMSGRQGQVAELILNPPALGSVEVRLNLSGGEAGAQFYSPHAAVRDAIEAALPRLRDMMAEAGLALGEAMVSNQPFQHRNPGQAAGQAAPGHDTVGAAEQHLEGARSYRLGAGLVDYYA
jgi:flagellar hook-length control protein FliK